MHRPRTDSNWGTIHVVDDSGQNVAAYTLDRLGRLQEKLGRQKNRRLKKTKAASAVKPTSIIAQSMGDGYNVNDLNKISINENIIDENNSHNLNAKQSLNLNLDSKLDLITKEDQNKVKDNNIVDFPLDFFVKDDYFECGDALENFYDVGNMFNDQENLECGSLLYDQF